MSGHHIVMPSTYIKVLTGLMVLMVLTIVAAKWEALDISIMANLIIALAIATSKMLLVMTYFMHLKWSSGLVRIMGGVGFLFLFILLAFFFADYVSRDFQSPLGDVF